MHTNAVVALLVLQSLVDDRAATITKIQFCCRLLYSMRRSGLRPGILHATSSKNQSGGLTKSHLFHSMTKLLLRKLFLPISMNSDHVALNQNQFFGGSSVSRLEWSRRILIVCVEQNGVFESWQPFSKIFVLLWTRGWKIVFMGVCGF